MSPIQDKMHKMDDSINQTNDLAQRVALAKEAIKLQEEMRHQTSRTLCTETEGEIS